MIVFNLRSSNHKSYNRLSNTLKDQITVVNGQVIVGLDLADRYNVILKQTKHILESFKNKIFLSLTALIMILKNRYLS